LKEQTVGELGEERLIERLIAPIATDIGDDVAKIYPPAGHALLMSTDALVENVHFLREIPADWVGHKALGVNVSDIAASGGTPRWATLALNLPGGLEVSWVTGFLAGFGQALERAGVALVGGDVTGAPRDIGITVTILGVRAANESDGQKAPIDRCGARPGDYLVVTGRLGETLPGLQAMLGKRTLAEDVDERWRRRHFFLPNRVDLASEIYRQSLATAMMDLSDGLAVDLPRLGKASNVGAEVELEAVPISDEFRALNLGPEDAVSAGEDFELLLAVKPKQWPLLAKLAESMGVPIQRIGRATSHLDVTFLRDGKKVNLGQKSWRHFQGDDVV